jgi:branched-chain amino acid transport system ATP-binding protein
VARIGDVTALFPILRERLKQPAGLLSGGEQQMLAIARALMKEPRLLLLDEPSLGLAPLVTRQVFDIVQEIRQRGTTVILVEQNARMALKIADYAYVLANGRVTLAGTAAEVAASGQIERSYLGG